MPSDEAMRAAEAIYQGKTNRPGNDDGQGEPFSPEESAKIIDRETRLPALLAVAEAARELSDRLIDEADYSPEVMDLLERLRAALEKLPPEGGKTQ